MERYCSTGQSPQRAVATTEEEEEEPRRSVFTMRYKLALLMTLERNTQSEAIQLIFFNKSYSGNQ
jgi:hypothetical protein